LKRNQNTGGCQACRAGFTMENERCFPSIFGCNKLDKTGKCLGCARFMVLPSSKHSCWPYIEGCNEMDDRYGFCRVCHRGNRLSKDKEACLRDIEGCIAYKPSTIASKFNKCGRCQNELVVSADGRSCVPSTKPSSSRTPFNWRNFKCIKGWRFTDDHRKCLPLIDHCALYLRSSRRSRFLRCAVCREGYLASGDQSSCRPKSTSA
jgi:hypothetical protein